jgi:hypothetical protein
MESAAANRVETLQVFITKQKAKVDSLKELL